MKKNKYLKKIRENVKEYGDAVKILKDLEETYKNQAKQGVITDSEKNYRIEQLSSKKEKAERVLDVKLRWVKDDYEKQLDKWLDLDSKKIDYNDVQLLKSGIDLKRSDYLQLEEKHKNNYMMLRVLYDNFHEKKSSIDRSKPTNDTNHLVYFRPSYTTDGNSKLEALNNVIQQARSMTKNVDSYEYRLWDNDRTFEQSVEGVSLTLDME